MVVEIVLELMMLTVHKVLGGGVVVAVVVVIGADEESHSHYPQSEMRQIIKTTIT